VDPLSVEQMADGLERLSKDIELTQDLIAKGRAQRKLFSWDQAAAEVFKVITEVKKP
jgi:glycosyltransferase involved in cell wall biosynthesis